MFYVTVPLDGRAPLKKETKEKYMAATKMTQSQIMKELAAATGSTTKAAKTFVETFADLAVRETKKNGVFIIPGIGRLVRVDRKARMGRNPATGEAIKIPAKSEERRVEPECRSRWSPYHLKKTTGTTH